MESAALPCEKKTCLGFNLTILRPAPACSRKAARANVMLLTSKEKIDGPAEFYSLSRTVLCTDSDITRTLSGIMGLAHTDCDRVFSESEDPLQASGFKNTLLKALDADIIERLHLHPVRFELKHEIESPGDPIDRLNFQ